MARELSVPPGEIDPDQILNQQFTTVRRGYDPLEVQTFMMRVGSELRAARDRADELLGALQDAEQRAAAAADMDPTRLTTLLGEETARVLEAARVAATEIRARAEENIALLLREAHDEAQAEMAQARSEAEAEAEAGRQRGREMVAEAQQVRERMLRDLARRRKMLRQQIEQLQAGRDRLLAAYDVVRETLAVATDELHVALPEAKQAARDVGEAVAGVESEAVLDRELEQLRSEVGVSDEAAEVDEVTVVEVVESEPAGQAEPVPKAPDPVEGRHSSSVRVIRTGEHPVVTPSPPEEPVAEEPVAEEPVAEEPVAGSQPGPEKEEVASIFARIKEQAELTPSSEPEREPDVEPALTGDAAMCRQRDQAVERVEHNLSRRLKRELSDEQNELLDALRQVKGMPSAADVLPTPEGQVERFAGAILPSLAAASAAGADFADTLLDAPRATEPPATKVGDLAEELGAELVAPLRERLEGCFATTASDQDELSELLRACYREWRGQRVDGPAAHAVLAAFNRGLLDRVPAGTAVHWVVDDPAAPSPDCDDNALAGSVAKGELFPTGHALPPIHPTCRCIVVPDPA